MTVQRYSAWLALGFGPVVLLQSLLRHWVTRSVEWPFLMGDVISAGLLVTAGALAVRQADGQSSRFLSGAWGFTWGSLWVSLAEIFTRREEQTDELTFILVAGWLMVTAVIGFIGSVSGGNQSGGNQNARP